MRTIATLLAASAAALVLAGCGVGSWFGEDEPPPLPGVRVSVLELSSGLEPDPALAGLPVLLPPAVPNPDFPQAGGQPSHVGGHAAMPGAAAPQEAWSADIGEGNSDDSRLLASPIVAGGRVYAMDAGGHLAAHDAENGRQAWRVRVANPAEDSPAVGGGVAEDGGVLYVSTAFGEVLAIDPANGGMIWRAEANGPLRAAPTVAGGRVFVVSVDNQLEALDAATGELLWSHSGILETAGLLGGASPAVGGGIVVAPYSSGEIYALRQETGRPTWSDNLAAVQRVGALANLADIRGMPVVDGDLVLAASHSGRMAAIDLRTGARVWEQQIGSMNMPWVAGDFVFVLTNDSEVLALTRADGRIRWATALPRFTDPEDRAGAIVWAGPVVAGGKVLAVGSDGFGVVLSAETGDVTNRFEIDGGGSTVPPAVAGGTLFVIADDGTLIAYR